MFNQWCTIESDPGVFTELVKKIGAPSIQVEQIYSMEDDELITKIQPHIYGFIFLFKWDKNLQKKEALSVYDDDLFFARQIVNNACATQAILSVALNAPIKVTGDLKDFYDFSKELTAEDRGLALSNSQAIRKLHNSFSRPEPFIFKEDKKKKKKEAEVYHFVSYVPHKEHLYELDGLQPGPILIGKFQKPEEWIALAKQQITNRIQKYSQKEIRFNLLVVCEDLKAKVFFNSIQALRQIDALNLKKASILKKISQLQGPVQQDFLAQYPGVQPSEQSNLQILNASLGEIEIQLADKHQFCEDQDRKASQRAVLNILSLVRKYQKKAQLCAHDHSDAETAGQQREIGSTH